MIKVAIPYLRSKEFVVAIEEVGAVTFRPDSAQVSAAARPSRCAIKDILRAHITFGRQLQLV